MDLDNMLIKRTLSGDDRAFEKIVNKYKGYIFAIILNFVFDHNEAADIAQEVFLQIYVSLPNYKFDNFKGWISRIATNKSIDWNRSKKTKFRDQPREAITIALREKELNKPKTPEDIFLREDDRRKIHRIFESIPPIYRNALIKFHLEGKSYEEIAHEEGTSKKTIASRLYRGRNIFKKKWREKDNETL